VYIHKLRFKIILKYRVIKINIWLSLFIILIWRTIKPRLWSVLHPLTSGERAGVRGARLDFFSPHPDPLPIMGEGMCV
jgi:hypothetical protein